jgi:hypothetical protein
MTNPERYSTNSGYYPGQTLGIVGFTLSFVLQPVALVVSIIALIQSWRHGKWNPFALAGIIISIASVVLFWLVIFALVSFLNTNGGSCAGLELGIHHFPDGSVLTCVPGLFGTYPGQ